MKSLFPQRFNGLRSGRTGPMGAARRFDGGRGRFFPRLTLLILAVMTALPACVGTYPPPTGPGVSVPAPRVSVPKTLPPELTPLSDVKVLTRGGLASLLAVELPLETFPEKGVFPIVVDVSDHWARKDILSAVKLGLLSVPANHKFQPDLPVTRGDVARALHNIMESRGLVSKPLPLAGDIPRDLPPGHTAYKTVREVLKSGVMHVDSAGRFNLSRPISGSEASGYLKRIGSLLEASR